MRVKDLADLAGTSVRTIRYYHQLGLLAVPEAGTSWRAYGFAHLTRLMRIRWLVESGVPLAEVPHMLRPPSDADERGLVEDDLTAVLASMDARMDALAAQRDRVATLLDRVREHGRLSPLPTSLVRMYAALLAKPLSPELRVAIGRERDLLELACYRRPLPPELDTLVDALRGDHLDALSDLWEQVHRLDQEAGRALSQGQRDRVDGLVADIIDLAEGVDPVATASLLSQAVDLDRPGLRAAVDLAYPSATYRRVVDAVLDRARAGDRAPADADDQAGDREPDPDSDPDRSPR